MRYNHINPQENNMDFEVVNTRVIHLGKVWKRIKVAGKKELGWASQGIQAYTIDNPIPQIINAGNAFINDCNDNNEKGDIIISRGGMGKAKRVLVHLLTKDDFLDAIGV